MSRFNDEETYLIIRTINHEGTDSSGNICQMIRYKFYFNNSDDTMLDVSRSVNYSCEMYILLNNMMAEEEYENEQREEEEYNEEFVNDNDSILNVLFVDKKM